MQSFNPLVVIPDAVFANSIIATLTVSGGNPCPGDLNGDGAVDLQDLATLLSHFGSSAALPEHGDIDGDGDVDLADLATLLSRFGSPCP